MKKSHGTLKFRVPSRGFARKLPRASSAYAPGHCAQHHHAAIPHSRHCDRDSGGTSESVHFRDANGAGRAASPGLTSTQWCVHTGTALALAVRLVPQCHGTSGDGLAPALTEAGASVTVSLAPVGSSPNSESESPQSPEAASRRRLPRLRRPAIVQVTRAGAIKSTRPVSGWGPSRTARDPWSATLASKFARRIDRAPAADQTRRKAARELLACNARDPCQWGAMP